MFHFDGLEKYAQRVQEVVHIQNDLVIECAAETDFTSADQVE
ncbi:hypothetical protein [Allobaculum sp. JKK-2023]|nr:hypothetical protein [Allobaculum sp. JKK-2023]